MTEAMGARVDTPHPPDEGARPWLAHYPPGVPSDIDVAALGTLADIFRKTVAAQPDDPAFISFGVTLTYAQIAAAAEAFTSWLQARGIAKGARVAIMMPNVLAYPAALFGTLLGGYVVVNVNPLYTPRELAHQLNDSGARVLVVLENFAHTVAEAWPELKLDAVIVAAPGDLMGFKGALVNLVSRYVKKAVPSWSIPGAVRFAQTIAEGRGRRPQPVAISGDDLAFLQYTGGTTGVAKGAMLTHRNIAANVEQSQAWFGCAAEDMRRAVMVTALPLYHIFALTVCCLYMVRIGGASLLIANPRDIPGFVKTLKGSRFTMLSGVNTLYAALANHPEIGEVNFADLRFSIAGGMAMQQAVAAQWKRITGKPVLEGYGLSETSPVVCANRPDIKDFTGTIGYPLPSTEVRIQLEDGSPAPAGTPGELCVRGPQVMPGYWQRPDETAKVMTDDGFFRTGDVGLFMADGQVKLVDRMKDMILVSGFNVYPNEVEDVLVSHPKVLEAAVIGQPDPHSGECVVAYIVPRDPSLTEEELREYAREQLTGYKIPRHFVFRPSLPKTNVGKVLRRALRDEAAQSTN
jgi:long-chain acyl-CoA synthetase